MSAEPQKSEPEASPDEEQDAWEREQAEAEQKLLDERVGMLVADRYRIVRTLGSGGMGGVYEAEHELIGKRVALKCLHREYSRDRDLVERFKREARAATAIGNEHIVDVTDMGDLPDGAPFLVMEVLQGQTLSDLIEEGGGMRIARAMHIARQVCDALGAAHDKGIVHRDLKPENIFLIKRSGDSDFVKVLDFGISKMHGGERKDRGLTRTGMAIGTPSYMSPEQAQGLRDVDQRTDIWALGVILYEMLTGKRPFDAESYPMLLMSIVGAEPNRIAKWRKDVPDALEATIMRCLEKPVGKRVQSMKELETELAKFRAVEGAPELAGEGERPSLLGPGGTVVRSKSSDDADGELKQGTAPTQLVPSTPPPPQKEASGVRTSQPASGTPLANALEARKGPTSGKDFGRSWPGEDAPPVVLPRKSKRPEAPGSRAPEGSSDARVGNAHTGEIGAVLRAGSTDGGTSAGTGSAAPPSNTPMIAAGGLALLLVVAGVGWAAGGGLTAAPQPDALVTAPVAPTPVPVVDAPPVLAAEPPPVAVAAPTEVRVRIQVMPIDARITINDVEFPNPMDALQTRSLTPTRIRAERDGYRTLEQLVIFDSDQNFHFELARGGGVQHVGLGPATSAPHEPTPTGHEERPAPPPTTGTGDGFRDQF